MTVYIDQCVGVRQKAGGACEVTGRRKNSETFYFNHVMANLFK